MKNSFVKEVMPYGPLEANQRFGGTVRSNLQGRIISHARNLREAAGK
jgi:hypothetical protein